MPLEIATYISDLVPSNPAASDGLNNADDHMRMIKATLLNTFPNINAAVTITDEQLNAIAANGPLRAPDGSIAAPGISFASNPGLGIYSSGAGIMRTTGQMIGNGLVPIGMIMDFAGTTAPDGWIACDGQPASTTAFANLFAAIGYNWGGSGATFVLPNLISGGRFRRHRDNGVYSGIVGTYQNATNMSHAHAVVGGTGIESQNHVHGVSLSTSAAGNHNHHTFSSSALGSSASTPLTPTQVPQWATNFGADNSYQMQTANTAADLGATDFPGDHAHTVNGNTGGVSAQHTHAINFTSGGQGDALEARPFAATFLACIKY